MKILIVYATNEGQTRKIAGMVASQIQEMGHECTLHDANNPFGELRMNQFDKIIIAGSIHDHRHQEALDLFVFVNRKTLEKEPTHFISVSLAAAFEESIADAEEYVEKFFQDTGWRPSSHTLVAGALRHGEYGYYEEMTLRHRVLVDRAVENPQADHEFTDWQALAKSVRNFVG